MAARPDDGAAFRLGPGDLLNVLVHGHDDLSVWELPILPDGSIALPLLGPVAAAGRTGSPGSSAMPRPRAVDATVLGARRNGDSAHRLAALEREQARRVSARGELRLAARCRLLGDPAPTSLRVSAQVSRGYMHQQPRP